MEEFRGRYPRQIAVNEIGVEGQKKICNGKVLIIGCGALGSMIAMQLAGAGVGVIGLADYDTIEISNLQRQFFFKTEDAGKSKLQILSESVKGLNPEVRIKEYPLVVTNKIAEEIFPDYDFIVDATDNPASKKMTGEISRKIGKGCCIGGVRDFEGQVITFLPDDSRFEDYFGDGAVNGFLPCSIGGVMGPTAALCASVQSSETIKYLTQAGKLLSGKLFLFNLLSNSFQIFSL